MALQIWHNDFPYSTIIDRFMHEQYVVIIIKVQFWYKISSGDLLLRRKISMCYNFLQTLTISVMY